jgi:mono/diheme cytochrome c family protein
MNRTAIDVSAIVVASLLTTYGHAAAPDAAKGRELYERNCQVCHKPGVHTRKQPLPITRDELRGWVDTFRRQANLAWTREDVEDVAEYLNQTYYRFPPERPR